MLITIIATLAYLGLAILGWVGFAAFFSPPPLDGRRNRTSRAFWCRCFQSRKSEPSVREDRADRWVIAAFGLIGLLDSYLPAYTDRKEFWTLDGENTPKTRSWPTPE
jgi:hypothetical protein